MGSKQNLQGLVNGVGLEGVKSVLKTIVRRFTAFLKILGCKKPCSTNKI